MNQAPHSGTSQRNSSSTLGARAVFLRMFLCAVFAGIAFNLALSPPQALAQSGSSTGAIRGTVLDAQGALVPNATVTIMDTAMGTSRTVVTDKEGAFQDLTLIPGTYEIDVQATGFAKLRATQIVITVGQTFTYDAHLKVGAAEVINVEGTAASLIDTAQVQQANTINQLQEVNLPNLSRNFTSLLFTLPGVTDSNAASIQDPNVGTGYQSSGASFGGGNGRGNLFTIDGGSNDYGTGGPRVAHIPQDSIEEFQVNRNAFNAEFGFTIGSAINVVTNSGTNHYHGKAFGYFNNETIDAVNYFNSFGDKAGQRPFEQAAIFGGSLGGFIKKDKLFFFTSFERQKLDNSVTTNLLGSSEAQGLNAQSNGFNGVTCPAPVTQKCYLAQLTAVGAGAIASAIAPALTPVNNPQFVNLVGPDSGTFDGNAIGAVQSAPGARGRYNNWVTRLDYQPNDRDNFALRLSLSRENNSVIGAGGTPRFTSQLQDIRDYTITGSWNRVFSANLVNTVRVQVVPFNTSNNGTPHGGAEFDFGALGTVGTIFDLPYNQKQNQYQFDDDLSITRGSHNFKVGGSFRPVQLDIYQAFLGNGDFQFQDGAVRLYDLFAGNAAAIGALNSINSAFGYPAGGPPSTNLSAAQLYSVGLPIVLEEGAGNFQYNATEKPFGLYAQDSWKAASRLTLNYGIRYDYDPVPNNYPSSSRVSPRAGLAWDPFGNGKTVVRAAGGIFTAPTPFIVPFTSTILDGTANHVYATVPTAADFAPQLEGALALEKSMATAANPNPSLTTAQLASVGINVIPTGPNKQHGAFFTVDPNFKDQYTIQSSASVQQELASNLSLEVSYLFYGGVHIQQIQEANLTQTGIVDPFIGPIYTPKPGTTQGEPNSTIVQNDETTSAGHSTYNGLTASLTKKMGRGLQFQANYTWSKALDNISDFSSNSTPFRPGLLNLDRGLSDYNVAHSFVANAVYTSPTHHGGDSFLRSLYSDFVIAPIVRIHTGVPFTILVPGIGGPGSNGNSAHTNEARPWHERRNVGIGPGLEQVDLRVSRGITLGKSSADRLNLIVQSSNILNHTNFNRVQNIFPNSGSSATPGGPTTSAPVATQEGNVDLLNGPYNYRGFRPVGAIQETLPLAFNSAAPPRQVSFGLELTF
ncbi:MAG TPA: TonB-dependent receptor [Acidobacteriaceae bacterium]|nr:TonB-dependent receptor [Acidobacteriaceae bacterium]